MDDRESNAKGTGTPDSRGVKKKRTKSGTSAKRAAAARPAKPPAAGGPRRTTTEQAAGGVPVGTMPAGAGADGIGGAPEGDGAIAAGTKSGVARRASRPNRKSAGSSAKVEQGSLPSSSKPMTPQDVTAERRRALIAERAYLRAESRGFVGGDPVSDWLEGEREIDELLSRQSL